MKNSAFLLVVATATTACSTSPRKPDFVIADEKDDKRALAFFMDHGVAKEHKVTPAEYEKAFRVFSDGAGRAIAAAVANMFVSDDGDALADRAPGASPPDFGIDGKAFVELFNSTRVEEWEYRPDGTHVVLRELPVKPMSLPKANPPASLDPTAPDTPSGG